MEHQEYVNSIKQELEDISFGSESYFQAASSSLGDEVRPNWYERDKGRFWVQLPQELQQTANSLAHRIVTVVGKLAGPAKGSPLLTEADQRDLSILAKTIRAAFYLRQYSHWDTEVLHDEGTVLGVQHAGQSEDRPLLPADAMRIVKDSLQRVTSIVDLLAASESSSLPSESIGLGLSRIRQNTAFIMMWMDPSQPELDDVCDLIKDVFDTFGIRAIRADDIEHEGIITERILYEISTSEFLIADLTGARPSVYYEVSYAHALNRRVILYRKNGTPLHFDLAGYNCPDYVSLRDLKEKLTKRLEQLTNKKPRNH